MATRVDGAIAELLEAMSAAEPGAGAGAGAAVAAGLAAAVVEIVAAASTGWPESGAIAAQAATLRRRGERLAGENAEAFAEAQAALLATRRGERPHAALGPVLEHAGAVPLAIAELGADVAALAEVAAVAGEPDRRPDAAAAAALAAGAADAAAHLVLVNLASPAEPARAEAAGAAAAAARASAGRALGGPG